MVDKSKRRPFLNFFLGVISALMAFGAMMGILGRIWFPDDSPSLVISSLIVFFFFLMLAIHFLKSEKGEGVKEKKNMSLKSLVFLLRAVIFIAVWIIMCIIGNLCYPASPSPSGIRLTDIYNSEDYNNWMKDSTNVRLVRSEIETYKDVDPELIKGHLYMNSKIKQDLGEDVYNSIPDTLGLRGKIDFYNNNLPKNDSEPATSSYGDLVFSLLGIILGIVAAYFCPFPKKWTETSINSMTDETVPESIVTCSKGTEKENIIYEKEDIEL